MKHRNSTFTPPHLRKFNLLGALALLLAACSQDGGPAGEALPDGQYPLEIASVSLGVEMEEQPWTRVTETADGSGSEWQDGDQIGVRLGDETAIYTLDASHLLLADQPLYWQSTAPADVTAWYPVEETVSLQDQTQGLAYVLQATVANAPFNQPVQLNFTHQLAKVRVVLDGTQAGQVTKVEVNNYPQCRNNRGSVEFDSRVPGWIAMHKVDAATWEANVVPGTTIDPANFIRLNGSSIARVNGLSSLEAGRLYTIDLTVGQEIIDLTADNCTGITGTGHYRVSGSFPHNITITGGSPTIYLENANINVGSDNAIDIQGGNPTIHVKGNGNEVSSSNGAGIYVAENSTVAITGNSRDDALTTRGGNGGSGIGGNRVTCGNIEISNMTVHAYGSDEYGDFLSAGIGGSGNNGCGTITIDNATIFAYGASDGAAGNMSTPGIGGGLYGNTRGTYSTIIIKNNSQVSVQRGSNRSDYIGSGGSTSYPANSPNGIDATVDGTSTIITLN